MPYHVLFVCTYNQCRSPTGEHLFADWPGIETKSAGVGDEANIPLSADLVDWADLVVVMEDFHREELSRRFQPRLGARRIVCVDIPDEYQYMDPVLVELLRQKVAGLLPLPPLPPGEELG